MVSVRDQVQQNNKEETDNQEFMAKLPKPIILNALIMPHLKASTQQHNQEAKKEEEEPKQDAKKEEHLGFQRGPPP